MTEAGTIAYSVKDSVGSVTFSHPKANSLSSHLLGHFVEAVDTLSANSDVKVILIRSDGEGAFCAGASFEEMSSLRSNEEAVKFFSAFGSALVAMKRAPKLVVTRVHGKAVGGGVGIIAASDYAVASHAAAVKLSELDIGLGPFVIGPCVERRIGVTPFGQLAIDTEWRDAQWAHAVGLYSRIAAPTDLDQTLETLLSKLAAHSSDSMRELKKSLWHGTEHWEQLLAERAKANAKLLLGAEGQKLIQAAANTSKATAKK